MSKKTVIVDLTNVDEACGTNTTYMGGVAYVDDYGIDCDGCTDRGDNSSSKVWDYLSTQDVFKDLDDNMDCDYFDNGKKYEVTVTDDDKIEIKEIEKTTEITIELKGDIPEYRLQELVHYIDAQVMEDEEGGVWCDRYVIYVNKERW